MATISLPNVPSETIVDVIPPGALAHAGILRPVPVIEPGRRYDERAGCTLAHRYDAGEVQGTIEEAHRCFFFCKGGGCLMNGRYMGAPVSACLFYEPDASPGWERVRASALLRLPDGTTAVTSRADALAVAADLGAVIVGAVRVEV